MIYVIGIVLLLFAGAMFYLQGQELDRYRDFYGVLPQDKDLTKNNIVVIAQGAKEISLFNELLASMAQKANTKILKVDTGKTGNALAICANGLRLFFIIDKDKCPKALVGEYVKKLFCSNKVRVNDYVRVVSKLRLAPGASVTFYD